MFKGIDFTTGHIFSFFPGVLAKWKQTGFVYKWMAFRVPGESAERRGQKRFWTATPLSKTDLVTKIQVLWVSELQFGENGRRSSIPFGDSHPIDPPTDDHAVYFHPAYFLGRPFW